MPDITDYEKLRDAFNETRRTEGFADRKGQENRAKALDAVADGFESIESYQEWLKRHD